MKLLLPVESVRERDVDFLIVEEFLSSKEFVNFFTDTLKLPSCDNILRVERSINDFGLGETDVLVEYGSETSKIGVLIENKLDALFQPQQAERYFARAAKHLREGTYDHAYVVLAAPQQYVDRQKDFSLCISYEQLANYFDNSDLGERGNFKAQLLKIAVEKLRRGYTAVNSGTNQAFWYGYREYLATNAPLITMKPVSVVPAGSDWIDLAIESHKFVHKLARGYLDFTNLSAGLEASFESAFGERVEHLTFKSGATLRISTTPMDRGMPLQDQLSRIEQCVKDMQVATSILVNNLS